MGWFVVRITERITCQGFILIVSYIVERARVPREASWDEISSHSSCAFERKMVRLDMEEHLTLCPLEGRSVQSQEVNP